MKEYILQDSLFDPGVQSVLDTETGEKLGELITHSDSLTAVKMNGKSYTVGRSSADLAIKFILNYKPERIKKVKRDQSQCVMNQLFVNSIIR